MSRDYRASLADMRRAIEKIERYVGTMDRSAFEKDDRTMDAVFRNLEVLGEAAKNVPEEFRKRYGEVAWRRIAGLRDILIHAYFGIDMDIVWDIINNKIPALKQQLDDIDDESSESQP